MILQEKKSSVMEQIVQRHHLTPLIIFPRKLAPFVKNAKSLLKFPWRPSWSTVINIQKEKLPFVTLWWNFLKEKEEQKTKLLAEVRLIRLSVFHPPIARTDMDL